jgi:hypothetical protein
MRKSGERMRMRMVWERLAAMRRVTGGAEAEVPGASLAGGDRRMHSCAQDSRAGALRRQQGHAEQSRPAQNHGQPVARAPHRCHGEAIPPFVILKPTQEAEGSSPTPWRPVVLMRPRYTSTTPVLGMPDVPGPLSRRCLARSFSLLCRLQDDQMVVCGHRDDNRWWSRLQDESHAVA